MTEPIHLEAMRRLELAGRRTWPALEEEFVRGWLCRAAEGVTRRSNTVVAMDGPEGDIDGAVDAGISWLAERGLPAVFRTTALSPPGLDEALTRRGLAIRPGATIMTRPLDGALQPQRDVEMSARRTEEWSDVLADQKDRSGRAGKVVAMLLDGHTLPCGFGLRRHDTEAIAVGMAVVDGDHVGVFNMRTLADHQRRGHAARILDSLLSFGHRAGATTAFLQVAPTSQGARALYESAGFEAQYDYWYWQQPN